MSFVISCLKCGNEAIAINNEKLEGSIKLTGQVECLFDADVYIDCKSCGNEITIDNNK